MKYEIEYNFQNTPQLLLKKSFTNCFLKVLKLIAISKYLFSYPLLEKECARFSAFFLHCKNNNSKKNCLLKKTTKQILFLALFQSQWVLSNSSFPDLTKHSKAQSQGQQKCRGVSKTFVRRGSSRCVVRR